MALDLKKLANKVRVTDGAWGTQLQAGGLPAGAAPELWNVENAPRVLAVAQAYVDAGSEIILTNTFGANRFALAAHGLGDRAVELAQAGAAISKQAAGKDVLVFGSIGPTGKIVMMQDVPEEELELAFAQTAAALARGGADAIVLETFNELDEIKIAMRAVKKATDLPVIASMTFASGPDKTATMMGNTPGDLVRAAQEAQADAVGANCGLGPQDCVRICELLRSAAAGLPIWIKPNAGLPLVAANGATTFPMGPDEFAAFVPRLVAAGANFIGGCCGATPRHVRAVRTIVDRTR